MAKATRAIRLQLGTAAAAMLAAGLLAAPTAAASPACDGYKLPSFMGITENITQSDNISVTIGWAPDGKSGRANMNGYGGDGSYGNVSGGLSGRHTEFRVNWDQGPHNGSYSRFAGDVKDDLSLDGVVENGFLPLTYPWHMEGQVECVVPKPNTSPGAGQNTATVVSDVDVYDKKNEPDGAGKIVGILRSPNTVQLLGPCQKKSWCNVAGDAVPTGSGWVWGALDF